MSKESASVPENSLLYRLINVLSIILLGFCFFVLIFERYGDYSPPKYWLDVDRTTFSCKDNYQQRTLRSVGIAYVHGPQLVPGEDRETVMKSQREISALLEKTCTGLTYNANNLPSVQSFTIYPDYEKTVQMFVQSKDFPVVLFHLFLIVVVVVIVRGVILYVIWGNRIQHKFTPLIHSLQD